MACLIAFLFISSWISPVYGQDEPVSDPSLIKARALMNRLSPAEKIGQLFLITMDGTDVGENSPIYELIQNYHIGGILLKRENDNFSNDPDVLINTSDLTKSLQQIEADASSRFLSADNPLRLQEYIPLFIGINQMGDVYPDNQILGGLTPIPSHMAIGATWNPKLAENVGEIQGSELSSLGINLIFGPSLDISDNPVMDGRDDLGVKTFGGDPFWVGTMGKAFIKGLKEGSGGQLAVITKNFPGRGASDRLPEEEVATVRKSLEQLKLIELAPFFRVTDTVNTSPDSMADGLLINHIRYQGFQGNIRATTKPVSFDQAAVNQLISLEPFSTWREAGGILVSDDLGSQSVEEFFNSAGTYFDGTQIARNAFLAGNDILYIDDLISTGDGDRFATYKKVIEFFIQKYLEDQVFAERVDQSVLRILALKFDLYPDFEIESLFPEITRINLENSNETVFEVARNAVTLISPKLDQLAETVPDPPALNETITIFSDTLSASQCTDCSTQEVISVNSLENAILSLYGRQGSGQVSERNIFSYSFTELNQFSENPINKPDLETNLSKSEWVIFVVHQINQEIPDSTALKNLLSLRPEVLIDKKVIVFAFGPPYYYDATEISYFSAYYGLFSKTPQFFEVAARILFQEITPQGSSPVSIQGVAYDLITMTSPDPEQVIELLVDLEMQEDLVDTNAEESGEEGEFTAFRLGGILPVRTGVIYDHNGNPVPDGTVVRFMLNLTGENITIQQIESTTTEGVARALIKLQSPGLHEIRVSSEPAMNSQILLVDISEEEGAIISAITPTPIPTISENGTEETPVMPIDEKVEEQNENSKFLEWIWVSIVSWVSGAAVYSLSKSIKPTVMRGYLSMVFILGGLTAGLWIVSGLPGSFSRVGLTGFAALTAINLIGGLIAVLIFWGLNRILGLRKNSR